jgi:hypothetical protein
MIRGALNASTTMLVVWCAQQDLNLRETQIRSLVLYPG